jgi:hypothetical protein
VAVGQAHEPEPGVADVNPEAKELDPEFVPDHSDRMALLVKCPVYR